MTATRNAIDVAGRGLCYQDIGTGPAVVCLHGAGPGATGTTAYRLAIDVLSEHHRVIVVDLPGFGASDPVPMADDPLRAYAAPIRALLGILGLREVDVIGHSFGGGVALRLALDEPGLVPRLVLISSLGYPLEPGLTDGARLIRRFLDEPSEQRMRDLLDALAFRAPPLTNGLVAERREAAAEPGRLAAARALHGALAAPDWRRAVDLSSELHRLTSRTLLVWGREDRFVPFNAACGLFAAIPDVWLHALSACGHTPQSERPAEVNAALANFLAPED